MIDVFVFEDIYFVSDDKSIVFLNVDLFSFR